MGRPPLSPLRLAPFRRLLAAYSVNNLGDWLGEIALSLLVLHLTGSVVAVTAVWVLGRFVPGLLAPFAVAALERLPSRRLLPGLHLAEAAVFSALALCAARGAGLTVILVLAVLDGVLAVTARALVKAAVVAVTRPAGLHERGNMLIGTAFATTVATGPLLAGAVIALLGIPAALAVDAATFALAAAALGIRARLPEASAAPVSALARLRAGIAHLAEHHTLRTLILAEALAGVFFALIIPVELVFVTRTIGGTESDFGLVLAAWGAGSVAGSFALSALTGVERGAVLLGGVALMIGGYLGMGAAGDVGAVIAFAALGGFGNGLEGVLVPTLLQERTPDALQTHLNGLIEAMHALAPGLGFLLGGAIAAAASPRATYFVAGLGALAVVAGATATLRAAALRCATVGA